MQDLLGIINIKNGAVYISFPLHGNDQIKMHPDDMVSVLDANNEYAEISCENILDMQLHHKSALVDPYTYRDQKDKGGV